MNNAILLQDVKFVKMAIIISTSWESAHHAQLVAKLVSIKAITVRAAALRMLF